MLEKKIDTNEGVISRFVESQAKRSRGIARNSSEPTITAVNQDWGFCVFNAGKNLDITKESKVLVKRGANILGRLKIIAVEDTKTVANIDFGTMADGATVLPGDKVIFQNLES